MHPTTQQLTTLTAKQQQNIYVSSDDDECIQDNYNFDML